MTKKVLKYVSLALALTTIILAIINLVFYYNYTNILSDIQNGGLTELVKFELQETKNLFLYRTLALIPWTCVIAILTVITSAVSFFIGNKTKNNYMKIR